MAVHALTSVLAGLAVTLGGTLDVADYLHERRQATDVPGLAYAVVGPDGIHEIGAWGTDGDGDEVTRDTPFLWGSVAKPVTATAIMTLVEDDVIDLDEPVRTYLPSFRLADAEMSARITVRHLLEQTSGLPEGIGVTDRFYRRDDPYADAVADLADARPRHEPGSRHEYTSANYLVLGAVVEAVTGQPYAQYLHDSVLDPLDMDGAITTAEQASEVPAGHRYVFGQPIGFDVRYDPAGASYGYLGGTVTDLAHFAVANLAGGRYGDTAVLDADSVPHMHTGSAPISDTHRYGLGWRDDDRNDDLGTRTIWHAGAAPGYQAMIVLLPEKELGLVVVQNAYGFFQDSALAGTGLAASRLLAGGEPAAPAGAATYPISLGVLSVVVAILLVALTWSIRRLARPRTEPRIPRSVVVALVWVVGMAALAYAARVTLPQAMGTWLTQVRLFAPDVGWLLIAIVVLAVAIGLTRLGVIIRELLSLWQQ